MKFEWEEVQLSDIADLTVGFVGTMAQHYTDRGITFLRSTNVEPFKFNFDDIKYISPEFNQTIKKSELHPDDVVIVRTGKPGACAVIPDIDGVWNCSDLVVIHPNKSKVVPLYLAAYINLASGHINAHLVGAVQQHFNVGAAKKMKILLPPVEMQLKIARIIEMLNEKIAINQQINDNLEQQARTLVQQWIYDKEDYIEFIPLSEVAIINPESYSPKEKWKYVNYLDTSSITGGVISEIQFINPESEKLPSRAKRKIKDNDIVFSTVRPNQLHYGLIKNPLPNMLASTGFAVIRSQNELITNELIYLCLTDDVFVEKMQQLAEQSTSTYPSIKSNDLSCCEIPVAQETVVKPITDTLCAIFEMIANNQLENARLANLRDSLLPKLMSGEIDVSAL